MTAEKAFTLLENIELSSKDLLQHAVSYGQNE